MDRRDELAEARRLLSVARLLTLIGPGGVGKTRLAARVAEQVSRAFPDGVWLVPLAAIEDGALVPQAVADALGVRNESGEAPLEVVLEQMSTRRLLLVLDNCEHIPDACASLINLVLNSTEGVRVLATSRHRLGLTEEHLLTVPPLRAPEEAAPLSTAAAEEFPALRLFADRAAAVVPGFEITAANRAAVARMCRRLDGLPLAIELAAVRMHALGIEELDERLKDRYRLLTSGSPAAPARHQTLRAAVDWSHDLCTSQEQLAWARLAVFPGDFDLAAAEAVCAGDGLDRAEVLDTVSGLVEKSILLREDLGGTVRYRLLALLRQYGLEWLEALGEAADAHIRHCDHFLRLARETERQWFGPDQATLVARLHAEQDNLRAALDFCLEAPGEAQRGLRLLGGLWPYWAMRGAWAELRHLGLRLLRRAGGKQTGTLAKVMWLTAAVPTLHSRIAAMLVHGPDSVPALEPDSVPPVKPLADLLAAGRMTPDGELGFQVLNRVEIACTYGFRGRPERAVPLCTEALAVCEAAGEQWIRSYVLQTLAIAQWATGDHTGAADSARRCLRLPYVAGEQYAAGRTLEILAVIALAQGDAERAAVIQGAARRIWYDVGHDPLIGRRQEGQTRASERQARRALGDRGYERSYRRGYELPADKAIGYGLGEPDRLPDSAAAPAGRPIARPRIDAGTGPGTVLTPREREVAGLIAQGLTNRQIAEALVISQRTAESHVERILAKLGFAKRSQVAAWISAQEPQDP